MANQELIQEYLSSRELYACMALAVLGVLLSLITYVVYQIKKENRDEAPSNYCYKGSLTVKGFFTITLLSIFSMLASVVLLVTTQMFILFASQDSYVVDNMYEIKRYISDYNEYQKILEGANVR